MARALRVTKGDGVTVSLDEISDAELGDGDVVVDIEWSGLNYKDALALAGNPGVMRIDPLIPGIDLVGTVSSTASTQWKVGDAVLLNGWGIGETHHGGLATRAVVSGDWLIGVPPQISPRRAAAIGTAGFTAMLSVLALERGGVSGEVLVTGASGGVGSIAISLLARLGYSITASTGSAAAVPGSEGHDYLRGVGATSVIDRAEFATPGRPLQSQRWGGAIDSVGGVTLANVLAQTRWGGTVAACGLVGGSDLPTTVMPFILRGVTLAGINSVECPASLRQEAWGRLARDLDLDLLDSITASVSLADAPASAARLLTGAVRGRTVVDVRA